MSITTIKTERNVALDLAKGVLVMLMVVYHCASMASGTPAYGKSAEVIIGNITFISRAFLLMSGLLCGMHYLPQLRRYPEQTRKRLAVRGLKLILIFLIINLTVGLSGIIFSTNNLNAQFPKLNYFKSSTLFLFLLGFAPGDLFSFEILYYIGLFLIVTSVILSRINFIYPLAVIFLINKDQIHTIWGLTFGFIGVLAGTLWDNDNLKRFWGFLKKLKGAPIILLFFGYRLFYDKLNSLFNSSLFFISATTYCLEIMLWLLTSVFILQMLSIDRLNNIIILLGRYTLILYIVQMGIIRFNYIILAKYITTFANYYIINVIISSILLYAFVLILNKVRMRNELGWVNKGYKLIFN